MAGVVFGPHVDQAGAQGFAGDGGVEMAFVADRIEVELAAIDRKIASPVVRNPGVGEDASLGYRGQTIRTALRRWLPRRFGDVALGPVVRRHDGMSPRMCTCLAASELA